MKKYVLLIIIFLVLPFYAEAAVLELHGYAWSSNIGWISFNSKDSGGGSPGTYAVKLDTVTGYFSGHAWSSNVGWISFNISETGQAPESPACDNGACIAKVEEPHLLGGGNRDVKGWARVLSACPSIPCATAGPGTPANGPWDGWILLGHDWRNWDDEVKIDSTNPWELVGYAWGGEIVGWISFDHDNRVHVEVDPCSCTEYTNSACGADSCSANQTKGIRSCIPAGCAVEDAEDCFYNEDCCNCTDWTLGNCGENGCSIAQRRELRTCNPPGCDSETRNCIADDSCYHNECSASYPYTCLLMAGEGSDQCNNNNQCRHLGCVSLRCDYVAGSGGNDCNNDEDCCDCDDWELSACGYGDCDDDERKQIRTCQGYDCVTEGGCISTNSCYHTECNINFQCERVLGEEGINACGDPSDNPLNHGLCQPMLWDWWEIIARQFGG